MALTKIARASAVAGYVIAMFQSQEPYEARLGTKRYSIVTCLEYKYFIAKQSKPFGMS